jgi:hypothetical protein
MPAYDKLRMVQRAPIFELFGTVRVRVLALVLLLPCQLSAPDEIIRVQRLCAS